MTENYNPIALWALRQLCEQAPDYDQAAIQREWPKLAQRFNGNAANDARIALRFIRENGIDQQVYSATDPGAGWVIYSAQDAYKPRPPREYVVDGVLKIPSINIPYGAPGDLKTMLMMDLASCVSMGQDWLTPELPALPGENGYIGTRKTKKNVVLWLDFDQGKDDTHERFEAINRAYGVPDSKHPPYYVSVDGPWLDGSNDASMAYMADWITRLGAKLVFVDCLANVSGGADENSTAIGQVLRRFRQVSELTRSAIVIIHHQRKDTGGKGRAGDMLRGHSSILANLNLALWINRDDGSDEITVKCTKSRGVFVRTFGAKFVYSHKQGTDELESARFYGVPVIDPNDPAPVKAAIVETVTGQPGLNKTALKNAVKEMFSGFGVNYISKLIDELAEQSEILQTDGKRTNEKIYHPA